MTVSINDLEMTQELGREAMAATRGGHRKHYWHGYGPRNSLGDIERSVVVNDGSSLDNTGGVIVTGDGNATLSFGAGNTFGDKTKIRVNF